MQAKGEGAAALNIVDFVPGVNWHVDGLSSVNPHQWSQRKLVSCTYNEVNTKPRTWRKNTGKINKLPHIFYNKVTDTFDKTWKRRNFESSTGKLRIYKTF